MAMDRRLPAPCGGQAGDGLPDVLLAEFPMVVGQAPNDFEFEVLVKPLGTFVIA
jgi:hypothetical protein